MSGIGTGTAMMIAGGLTAGGSVASGLIGSNAAENAASTQAKAAQQAAQMQGQLGQEGLALENQQNQQSQANLQPYLQTGDNANATLQYLMGIGGENPAAGGVTTGAGQTLSIPGISGSVSVPGVKTTTGTAATNLGSYGDLMKGYSGGEFKAPSAEQARQAPGYQFGLQEGLGAQQASAAANGTLLTGGTQAALNQNAQNYADTNYNNVYNQALQTYGTNYNNWANQKTSEYNRLAGMAGMGQTAANTMNTDGLQSTSQMANTLTNTGQQVGQQNNNAAAATASGYVGAGNAYSGMASGLGNSLSQLMMMRSLYGGSGSGGSGGSYSNPNDMFNLDYTG
jgi:hypothetical protein